MEYIKDVQAFRSMRNVFIFKKLLSFVSLKISILQNFEIIIFLVYSKKIGVDNQIKSLTAAVYHSSQKYQTFK